MKVVIFRKAPAETQRRIMKQFPSDWELVILPAEEAENAIVEADAIIPENTIVDETLLARAENLKIIQTGAGYDNIQLSECTRRGIYVANAAGINARAVAEHVFAFILCWYKSLLELDSGLKSGRNQMTYTGAELSDKTIGIVGLGHIGKEVARVATAFGMTVVGYHYRQVELNCKFELMDLPALLQRVDIVTLHVRLKTETCKMVGPKEFDLMKTDAFFINTSRGAVVDESALVTALKTGKIGGAGLDVFETEPLSAENPLGRLKNVILTPHMAGEPDGTYFHKKRFKFFAENIGRILRGELPENLRYYP